MKKNLKKNLLAGDFILNFFKKNNLKNNLKKYLSKTFLFFGIFIIFLFPKIILISEAGESSPAPFNLKDTSIIKDNTNNRVINKEITYEKDKGIKSSSLVIEIVPNVFELAFFIASALAILAIIYGGFLMITSLGDSGKQSKGWNVFSYSIGGLVLMLLSRAIVGIVSNLKIANETAYGDEFGLSSTKGIDKLPSGDIITEIIPQIIKLALQLVSAVIVVVIIYAGIMYITNPDEEKGKMGDLFLNAVIGLILILISYVIVASVLAIKFG